MTKTQKGIRFRYGFRHDPMKWINESESVPAAQVRTFCLKRPKPGDKAILEAEIEKLLSEQNPDGSLGDQDTTGKLIRLERLGCSPDRENVQRAVAYVCNKEELQDNGTRMGVYGLHVARWGKWQDEELLASSTANLAKSVMEINFWGFCPWGGQVHVNGMWAGRDYADITKALNYGLKVMLDGIQDGSGWPVYLDPFGFLDAAANIDHELARAIVIKEIPMILRTQYANGSWGGRKHLGYGPDDTTYIVLRALIRWDLFETLQQLPPLPEDWRIVRSVPGPGSDLAGLVCADGKLWIHDKTRGLAVALSSETGDAVASVKLPDDVVRIGQLQDGRVALLTRLPGDDDAPATTWAFDPTLPQPPTKVPDAKWRGNENEWCLYDFWGGPPILHKRPKHPLAPDIDSGDAPFRQYTTGVASDGTNLWVLDNKDKRVCIVEKAKSGKHPTVPINK